MPSQPGSLCIAGGLVCTPDWDFRPATVFLSAGRVERVEYRPLSAPATGLQVLDASGCYVCPGFVDLHVNGGGGADFHQGTPEAIETILRTHAAGGTTSLLAAINTAPDAERERALAAVKAYMRDGRGPADLLGAYIEGPYYSPRERGAHPESLLREPRPDEYVPFLDRFDDAIRVFSLAPELPGAVELCRELRRRRIVAAAGHSNARFEDVLRAMEAGLSLVAHIYCAQSTFHRTGAAKHLGLAESALLLDDLYVEIIPDGKHLPVEITRLVLRNKPPERVCVTTDAISAAGVGPGRYRFLGTDIVVEDGVAWRPDRQRYAGSVLTMATAVRNLVCDVGVELGQAVRMATETPCRVLGIADRKGTLEAGKEADVVVLDEELLPRATVSRGEVVWSGGRWGD
jgi:N-acetylglucosamine-6-phosphate deacetylase